MSDVERRRNPRWQVPASLFGAWQAGTQQAVARLGTLALGGLSLQAKEPPKSQSMIQLLVETPTGDLRARGIVRWSAPKKGMGVEFVAMTPEDRGRLIQYLHRLAAA